MAIRYKERYYIHSTDKTWMSEIWNDDVEEARERLKWAATTKRKNSQLFYDPSAIGKNLMQAQNGHLYWISTSKNKDINKIYEL